MTFEASTDQFECEADKLAYRMREGMFRVIDVDVDGNMDWPPLEVALGTYAIKPGNGGHRYLRNIAARLNAVGFYLDSSTNIWLRPKVIDGKERLLNLETLHELSAEERNNNNILPLSGREGVESDSEGSAS